MSSPRTDLVIAIDLGTYSSGFAWQWSSVFKANKTDVTFNKTWNSRYVFKTPTCILFKDERVFKFGDEAESDYMRRRTSHREGMMLFKRFKMCLYQEEDKVSCDHQVKDVSGTKSMPLVDLFKESIVFMKDKATKQLRENYPNTNDDIINKYTKWVLTVPAIWPDRSKQVMREAAEKAGITSEMLTIGIEPECAAIICSQNKRAGFDTETLKSDCMRPFMFTDKGILLVIDLGGGTVDITAVEILEDNRMRHIMRSGGGPWGGHTVNGLFEKLMESIVGEEVFQIFQTNREMYSLMEEFENEKRKFRFQPDGDTRIEISMPGNLKTLWIESVRKEDEHIDSISSIIKSRRDLQEIGLEFEEGMLSFEYKTIKQLFDASLNEIKKAIEKAIIDPSIDARSIDCAMLVGGFAMSNYVVDSIRELTLGSHQIQTIRLENAETAVLHGAVLFGQDENVIKSRRMQLSYGIESLTRFDESVHDRCFIIEMESQPPVAHSVFQKHVEVDQSVNVNEWTPEKEYFPDSDDQTELFINVWTSKENNPIHITESCKRIGNFKIKIPSKAQCKRDQERKITVSMKFGGTEVVVKAKNGLGKEETKHLMFE